MIRVLFVCLGNICRSPMAEAVFRKQVQDAGLADAIAVDSAGIGGWHAGERPHRGTLAVLAAHGVDASGLCARQVTPVDIRNFDYIVAMDEENLDGLERLGARVGERVFRLLDIVPDSPMQNVPDPYYSGNFDLVYDLVERGCAALLQKIRQEHGL
ncbi:low molecular weight protein-tyrosine-phosphatase [Alicyclobacillus contaminans]|uniref:low molecular weight protein-tyrosine-phosphatase n=1 Tax=Alicyclobacillus contaminans TaxID=392016 RepID=UPI000418AAC7|nr:low molecular weight protein-tyrosine-phosphatase [Alicyclobacillus contaminans]